MRKIIDLCDLCEVECKNENRRIYVNGNEVYVCGAQCASQLLAREYDRCVEANELMAVETKKLEILK